MRRYFSTLLGICLLASVNGCVSTAVGGGTTATTGTYSYFTRELSVIYALPLADVWIRALAAVESLQLHIDQQRVDGLGGDIAARRADGTAVQVHLRNVGDHSTGISVRVGFFGDREQSERVQRAIRQQLGV